VIRCTDTNYDEESLEIQLTGYRGGIQKTEGTTVHIPQGVEVSLPDFTEEPEADDLYTLHVRARDLAGNLSEEEILFSVNRFGSVYTFDAATEKLAAENGDYYTKEGPELVIMETNVDTLEFQEITCSLDGVLRTLMEGTDYTVRISGSDVSWKQYTYTIGKQNFQEEGTYLLTIYSEDRASNLSDNRTKGKKLEFTLDKTAPDILISGVENGAQYRENSREITLDVQDNISLSEVEVHLDGEVLVYSAAEVYEQDGRICLKAAGANHWQTLSVTARDAAGNQCTSDEIRFLLTPDLLVQFYMNKKLLFSTLLLLFLGGFGIFLRIICKRNAN
jgi:hypothetical protein